MTPARTLLAGAALALLLALSACGGGSDDERPGPRAVGRCSWSYFGDPRSVAFGSHVVTGCIGIDGRSLVEDYDTDSGERRLDKVFPALERDDHNNPSVIVFKGRLYAFSAPHSGYVFPAARDSEVRYRSRPADGGDWGPIASVPLGTGCGLGYTYPNLVDHRRNVEYDVDRVLHLLRHEPFIGGAPYAEGRWVVIPCRLETGR